MVNPPPVPELLGVPVAVLALIVAGAAFLVSLVALVWQIVKHNLEAGRVRVELNAALLQPNRVLVTNRTGKWELSPDNAGHIWPENIEVAQLVVENPGRAAVTVHSPSLAIEGHGKRQYAVSPRSFRLDDFGGDSAITATVHRIEPNDRATWLLDVWSVVPGVMKTASWRGITVRGSVRVAGRHRVSKSPFRLRWQIRPGQWTAIRGKTKVSPRTVMWRELYRSGIAADDVPAPRNNERRITTSSLGGLLFDAMNKFENQPTREEFQAALDESAKIYGDKSLVFGLATYEMFQALAANSDRLEEWTWTPKKSADPAPLADESPNESISVQEGELPDRATQPD